MDIQDKVKEDIKVKLVTPGNQLLLLDIQDKAVTQGNNQVKVVTQGNNQVKAVTQGNSLHQLRLELQVNSHMLPKGRQDMARWLFLDFLYGCIKSSWSKNVKTVK